MSDLAVYTAPAISCGHCKAHIEGALNALPGVEKVQVEVPTKTVTVQYDADSVSPEKIEAALAEEGYPVG